MVKILFIPGRPTAQGRARFAKIGGFVRAYDPKQSRDWKATVKQFAQAAGWTPTDQPCVLRIECHVARPKRLMRKRDPDDAVICTSQPDCSNYLKGVEDALNGIAYHDDSQLWRSSATKFYHAKDGQPGMYICLEITEGNPLPELAPKKKWPMSGEITMPLVGTKAT